VPGLTSQTLNWPLYQLIAPYASPVPSVQTQVRLRQRGAVADECSRDGSARGGGHCSVNQVTQDFILDVKLTPYPAASAITAGNAVARSPRFAPSEWRRRRPPSSTPPRTSNWAETAPDRPPIDRRRIGAVDGLRLEAHVLVTHVVGGVSPPGRGRRRCRGARLREEGGRFSRTRVRIDDVGHKREARGAGAATPPCASPNGTVESGEP